MSSAWWEGPAGRVSSPDWFPLLQQQCEDKWGHLCALADFAIALNESIQEINKHSFNNFELRIGELAKLTPGQRRGASADPSGPDDVASEPGDGFRASEAVAMMEVELL